MTTIRGYFALFAASLSVVSSAAAMATKPVTDVTCEIRSSHSSGDLRLRAVAIGGVRTAGEYELVVVKSGIGGSSDITQGGEFEVEPGVEAILGEVALGRGEAASVEATLHIKVDRNLVCQTQFPAQP
jgi:hypothetical protein